MDYLSQDGRIDLAVVDGRDYSQFHGKFVEDLDPHLGQLILDDTSTFKVPDNEYVEVEGNWEIKQKTDEDGNLLWVKNEQGEDLEIPRFSPESKTLLKKRMRLIKNGNQLEILYHQKKNVGRFYSNDELSMTCLARNIRNTIYHYQGWVDYDFVASHPTILACLGVKLRIATPHIDAWVKDKKPIIKLLSDHHSVEGSPPLQKDHIKKLINAALYGGGLDTWALGSRQKDGTRKGGIIDGNPSKNEMPMKVKNYQNLYKGHEWYKGLKEEIKKLTTKLVDANPDLKERVAPTSAGMPDWKRQGRTISYILGIFENECLYQAYQYGIDNGLITARHLALAYDGMTTTAPPPYTDVSFHFTAVNDYIFEKTGFKMKLEDKKFEDWTIQLDLIDVRRNMIIADAIDPVQAIQADGDVAVAEELDQPQVYLIWKEKFERRHYKIINQATYAKRISRIDPETEDEYFEKYKFFTKTELINAYEHESFIKVVNGRSKRVKYIQEWIDDPTIQRKDNIDVLPPPLKCPRNTLNLWKPSDYHGRDIDESSPRWKQNAVDTWCNHIKVMCDGDIPAYEYVLNWFAHLLQKPAQKSTHLIITGVQGTGKTIALYPIKKIMGGGYFESTQPERDVWGNFNPIMASALLVILSETDKRNSFGADGRIKALITDDEITIRDLHKAPFIVRSAHRFITPTNSFDPVKLEDGDRRNMIIKMSDEFKNNWTYFNNFTEMFDSVDALLTLYSWLMARNIEGWNFRIIPKTEYHKAVASYARNPLDEFLEWWVCRQFQRKNHGNLDLDADGNIAIFGSDMMREFRVWREEFGGKYDVNGSGDLMKKVQLSLNVPKGSIAKGQRTNKGSRTLFNYDVLRKHYGIGCLIDVGEGSGYEEKYDSGNDDVSVEDDVIDVGVVREIVGNERNAELAMEMETEETANEENVVIEEVATVVATVAEVEPPKPKKKLRIVKKKA